MTISPPVELLGVQRPRVCNAPPSVSTESGREAVELAASAGLILDPWQAFAVEVILAERADGKWAAFEAALLVARQNGKGGILETLELFGLFLAGERLILHSAHEFKTSQEAFLRIKALIDNTDDLRKRVARVRTAHGDEGIELIGGQRLRFVARSRSSGRGFTGDRVILDEAQELSRAAMGALLPTMSARRMQGNPQVVYAGTVPAPENDCEHFESLRNRGRAGESRSLAWLEWSPGTATELDELPLTEDRRVWAQANPALGFRISEEAIESEHESLGEDQFLRERLSVWPERVGSGVIDLDDWVKLQVPAEGERPSPVVFSVEVAPSRKWSSIGLAGVSGDRRHVQIVESGKGTSWLPGRLAELVEKWSPLAVAVDPGGPAGSLLPALREREVEPLMVTGRDYAQACGLFVDSVDDGVLAHTGQQLLAVSIEASKKRRTAGDAWVFHPTSPSVDISPLKAVTIALFVLAREATKPPEKPVRTGVVLGVR